LKPRRTPGLRELATLDAALVKAARAAKLALITDLSAFPEH